MHPWPHLQLPPVIGVCTIFFVVVRLVAGETSGGVLANTLFTFENQVCGGEKMHLRCPYGTTISVQWARYGRQVPSREMCGSFSDIWLDKSASEGEQEANRYSKEDINCLATTSLQVVLNKCQDRRVCKLEASAAQFGQDPCPSTSKYLEVAYKCRPNEFRSRISCEGNELLLQCKKSRRIAVYSALFGRDQRGNIECPAEARYNKDCQSACTLQTVMEQCHGRRRCSVEATMTKFGDPCEYGTPKYLKIVYTCVPKRILKEIKNNRGEAYPNSFCNANRTSNDRGHKKPPETETPSDGIPPKQYGTKLSTTTVGVPRKNGGDSKLPERTTFSLDILSPATTKPGMKEGVNDSGGGGGGVAMPDTTDAGVTVEGENVAAVEDEYVGFVTDWIYTYDFLKDNLEKLILYIILCVFFGLILLLITVIIRMGQRRHHGRHTAKLNISEPVPNSSGQTEDLELLSDSDRNDGVEILSINHNNRPPPFRTDTGSRSMNSSYYG